MTLRGALAQVAIACALVGVSVGSSACGTVGGVPFARAYAAGERAFTAGRWSEAAEAYAHAATIAERPRDRVEALYSSADALERAGKTDDATKLFDALADDPADPDRAMRSLFRAGTLRMTAGDRDGAMKRFDRLLRDAPEHGVARHALSLMLADVEAREGAKAVVAWEDARWTTTQKTRLGEELLYDASVRRAASGDETAALKGFLRCAELYPYPKGALFDDALWHASAIHERAGDAPAAIADLERILAVRESSSFNGTYELPRMGPSRFRIAELQRDKLHDHAAARASFHRVYVDHTTSQLRGRALYEEARLAAADGDTKSACDVAEIVLREFTDTRWARRIDEACPAVEPRARALREARDKRREP